MEGVKSEQGRRKVSLNISGVRIREAVEKTVHKGGNPFGETNKLWEGGKNRGIGPTAGH